MARGRFALIAASHMLEFVLFERLLLTQSGRSHKGLQRIGSDGGNMEPSKEKPKTLWDRMSQRARKYLVWSLWFITWLGLIAGVGNEVYFEYVVIFSAFHAVVFFVLFRFSVRPFPVQVRIGYLVWVAVGTYVPYMVILMYITFVGLTTNLFLGYCPLARMMYLLPWNRDEKFSLDLLRRVFISAPVPGKFQPKAQST